MPQRLNQQPYQAEFLVWNGGGTSLVSIINELISAVLQLLIFTAIPFGAYVIGYRRLKGFFDYIGLRRCGMRALLFATLFTIAFLLPVVIIYFFSPDILQIVSAPGTVVGKLRSNGFAGVTVLILIIKALLQTSLSEEIIFRGFIARRFFDRIGFHWGNITQGLIFGLVHLVIFVGNDFSILLAIAIVAYTGFGGWLSGYLNEHFGSGSILPGWWLHGLTNLIAYGVFAFG